MREILSNQKKVSKIRRLPLKIHRSLEKCRRFLKMSPQKSWFYLGK